MNEEQVKKQTKEWFSGDELATQVWLSKYALKDKAGNYMEESPLTRYISMTAELGRIEKKFSPLEFSREYSVELFHAMVSGKVTPGGSSLYGIANPYSTSSLGNCFVISLNGEDSYGSIMKVDEELVQISKRRGGVGFDISDLRPAGKPVQNAARASSGSTSFMPRFSNSTREVAQDGRRGALMLTKHIDHPDILKFIKSKRDNASITGANISIKITDEFMQRVVNDELHQYHYPIENDDKRYILKADTLPENLPETEYGFVRAKDLWDEIVKSNWLGAEPGLLFWDKIIKESPADSYKGFKTVSTNPCGELPLSPYDSCRLLSVNLVPIVTHAYTPMASINWKTYEKNVRLAVRTMDNIVELEIEKLNAILEKIESDPESWETKQVEYDMWVKILENTISGRRLGVSIIGHADLLASLNLKYDSAKAFALIKDLHEKLRDWSYDESIKLAQERGSFKVYDHETEVNNAFLQRLPEGIKNKMKKYGRRNIALLTIPPAGSLAIILRISSGIEPVFNLYYNRRRKVSPENGDRVDVVDDSGDSWQEYHVIHPGLIRWYDAVGELNSAFVYKEGSLATMSTEELDYIISISPYAGSTANSIDPIFKAKLIGMITKYIDHAVSSTTNLPENTTEETISDIYLSFWKEGAKGCTIYREGSRAGVLINKKKEDEKTRFKYYDAPKRPRILPCDVYHPTIHGERYCVLVGLYNGKPYEIMALKGEDVSIPLSMRKGNLIKQRSSYYNLADEDGDIVVEDIISKFEVPEWDALTRLTSTALRHGADINFVAEQLNKSNGSIVDVAKVIARTLKKYLRVQEIAKGKPCPNCGEPLTIEGGCEQCMNPECGYGKCG